MKKIDFKKINIRNFLSIGKDPVEIEFKKGLNIITGINRDKEDSKNGVGKCVKDTTLIDINIEDLMVLETFKNFIEKS